jgi:acyl-CoA thioesterase
MNFREATDVEAVGEGQWRGELAEDWDILGNTNGGYMQAISARASSMAVEGRDPVSVTGHFTRPGHTGPVEIETEVVRHGRRFSVVRARMIQDDSVILETLGTFRLPPSEASEILLSDIDPPDIPSANRCIPLTAAIDAPFPPPLMDQIDLRLTPDLAETFMGSAAGKKALVEGWFALKNNEELDPFALILTCDSFPPTAFAANFPVGWTPTLELTVHIRNPRTTGWLKCQFKSHFITGGFIEEDGLIWDEDGRLVAQSRQLSLVSTSPS